MVVDKMTDEKLAEFRDDIEQAVIIADSLQKYCSSIDELLGMLRHASENEGQLRLIVTAVANANAGKK